MKRIPNWPLTRKVVRAKGRPKKARETKMADVFAKPVAPEGQELAATPAAAGTPEEPVAANLDYRCAHCGQLHSEAMDTCSACGMSGGVSKLTPPTGA